MAVKCAGNGYLFSLDSFSVDEKRTFRFEGRFFTHFAFFLKVITTGCLKFK